MTPDLKQTSLQVTNFKCFGDEPAGFDSLLPMNFAIGRNNSGKSSLLDMVEFVAKSTFDVPQGQWHANEHPSFLASTQLTHDAVQEALGIRPEHVQPEHRQILKAFSGTRASWKLNDLTSPCVIEADEEHEKLLRHLFGQQHNRVKGQIPRVITNPLAGFAFRRIFADRDVTPEADGESLLAGNGRGTTNIIQQYLNKSNRPREAVQETLLSRLNKVFAGDARFTEIDCQQHGDGKWEIFLHEQHKGLIPLSQSGSGLKTVIILLSHMILGPLEEEKQNAGQRRPQLLACEELENNLHPSLVRRLFSELCQHTLESEDIFFFTTHSNVVIDQFSRSDRAQIVHVRHSGERATSKAATMYIHNCEVLDDLGTRASDILQSNGVIWVEGPSDRTYIRRWIEIASEGQLVEGVHYQCVFYGGKLLKHLSAESPEDLDLREAVSLLRANRNCCVVVHSDRSSEKTILNATKTRVIEELEKVGGFAWVTDGREIENYVAGAALTRCFSADISTVTRFGKTDNYLEKVCEDAAKLYKRSKPDFASKVAPCIEASDCLDVLDLRSRIERVCLEIRRWNDLNEEGVASNASPSERQPEIE